MKNPIPIGGILDLTERSGNNYNVRAQLNFSKSFANNHSIIAMLAGEASELSSENSTNRYYGYNDLTGSFKNTIDYLTRFPQYGNAGISNTIPEGDNLTEGTFNRIVSILGNFSYSYKNRYTLYGSARRDGANVFGVNTNNKWKPLWSVGASWDMTQERFWKSSIVDRLKMRASYGYMGNINNNLSGLPTVLYTGTARLTGLTQAQVGNAPNSDLRWEEVRLMNVGIDFSLFKRVSGSLDIFKKRSKDVISAVPFDPTSGVSLYTVNSASLKGNGFDFVLNSTNIHRDFTWNTGISLSYAKMKVSHVYGSKFSASDFIGYGLQPSVGQLAYALGSYKWAGLDPATGDPQGYYNKQVSKDYNAIFNDSISNQVLHGSAIPLYFGYLLNSFSYKGVTLSANITYKLDYYYRKPSINYEQLFNNWVGHADFTKRWTVPGDEKFTNVPSMIYPVPAAVTQRDQFYAGSEINVLRGDNIRLQDVRLQYNFTGSVLKKVGIRQMQVFLYANNLNLVLWRKDDSGLDPEFTGGNNPIILPTPKTLTGGLSISF